MSDAPGINFVDRSRIEAYQTCPRLRFLNYEMDGTGIERMGLSLPLIGGIGYHKVFEQVLKGEDLDVSISVALQEYADLVRERGIYGIDDSHLEFLIAEQSRLLECLARGWVQTRMPLFLERFEIHAVEQEFAFELAPGLQQMMRLDVIARRKSDGMLFIPDFKGTGDAADYWRESFKHNNQVNSYILAVQETLGERVGGMVIEGLIKGKYKTDDALASPFHGKKIQKSPFCYGYQHVTTKETKAEYTNRKGFVKIASWEHYSAIEWMELIGEETVRDQFLVMEIQAPEKRELDDWREEVIFQEERIAEGMELIQLAAVPTQKRTLLNQYFPKTRTACHRFNSPCGFQDLCYDSVVESDPIGSGFFQRRTPHHSPELAEQS